MVNTETDNIITFTPTANQTPHALGIDYPERAYSDSGRTCKHYTEGPGLDSNWYAVWYWVTVLTTTPSWCLLKKENNKKNK